MGTQRRKCTSESGRHSWKFFKNKVVRTQTMTTVHLTEKGIYSCKVCKLAKFGAAVHVEGAAA